MVTLENIINYINQNVNGTPFLTGKILPHSHIEVEDTKVDLKGFILDYIVDIDYNNIRINNITDLELNTPEIRILNDLGNNISIEEIRKVYLSYQNNLLSLKNDIIKLIKNYILENELDNIPIVDPILIYHISNSNIDHSYNLWGKGFLGVTEVNLVDVLNGFKQRFYNIRPLYFFQINDKNIIIADGHTSSTHKISFNIIHINF